MTASLISTSRRCRRTATASSSSSRGCARRASTTMAISEPTCRAWARTSAARRRVTRTTIPIATPTASRRTSSTTSACENFTYANYVGLRVSELRSSTHHTWKVGLDANRENSEGSQTYACYYVNCNLPGNTTPAIPATPANGYPLGYYAATSSQAQPGSQIGIYAQDKWQPSQNIVFDYGLRYDHSTGYASGYMIEPRIGVNVSDGGKTSSICSMAATTPRRYSKTCVRHA